MKIGQFAHTGRREQIHTNSENHKYVPRTNSDFDQNYIPEHRPVSVHVNSVNSGIPQPRNLRPLRDHARNVHSAYGFLVDADWPSKWVTRTTSPLLFK